MIIEFFGPPGSGKTTLAQALCERLRDRGRAATVILSHRQGERVSPLDPGGGVTAVGRIGRALASTLLTAFRAHKYHQEIRLTTNLVRLLPPKNPIWMLRFWQYILRMSRCWKGNVRTDRTVIFDQAHIQAVCSLAMFNQTADDRALDQALQAVPKADLIVCLEAPQEVLAARLRERSGREAKLERLFEAEVATNLRAVPIIKRIRGLLERHGHSVISVMSLDKDSLISAVDRLEREIIAHGDGRAEEPRRPARAPTRAGPSDAPMATEPERRMTSASAWAFMLYVGGAVLTSLVQFEIAKLIGAQGFGIFSYVFAWITFLAYSATLGFHVALLRFVPAHMARQEWPLARGVIIFGLGMSLLTSLAVAVLGAWIVWASASRLPAVQVTSLIVGMATVPAVTMYLVCAALTRAFGGVVSALLPERIVRDGLLVGLVVTMALAWAWPMDASLVMMALLASSVCTALLAFVTMLRLWPASLRGVGSAFAVAHWCSTILPLMAMTVLDVLMARVGVLLLGWMERVSEAGIFALAFSIAMLLMLPRVAVGTMFAPTAAELHARDDHVGLQRLFARASVLSFVVSGLLAAPLLLFMEPLLDFFDDDFVHGATVARILVVAQLFAAAAGPQQHVLIMTGHERPATLVMAAGTGINIVGCLIGIALFGATGAAVATMASIVFCNVALAITIYRRLDLMPGLMAFADRWRSRSTKPVAAE